MTYHNYPLTIEVGDNVIDPMDGEIRTIQSINLDTGDVFMRDGGVMGIEECEDVTAHIRWEADGRYHPGTVFQAYDKDGDRVGTILKHGNGQWSACKVEGGNPRQSQWFPSKTEAEQYVES